MCYGLMGFHPKPPWQQFKSMISIFSPIDDLNPTVTSKWESHGRNPNFLPFQKCTPFSFGFHRKILTIGCFSNFRHWTREASLRSCSTPRRCVLLIRLLKGYASLTGMDTSFVVGPWKFIKGWSYTEGVQRRKWALNLSLDPEDLRCESWSFCYVLIKLHFKSTKVRSYFCLETKRLELFCCFKSSTDTLTRYFEVHLSNYRSFKMMLSLLFPACCSFCCF